MALAFIVLNDGEYYRSILDGVNSGRDTDSIGVMIGVILGAMYGASVIEEEDIRQLNEVNRLDLFKIADAFSEVAEEIIREDLRMNDNRKGIFQVDNKS